MGGRSSEQEYYRMKAEWWRQNFVDVVILLGFILLAWLAS
jgi:hypothetical protein